MRKNNQKKNRYYGYILITFVLVIAGGIGVLKRQSLAAWVTKGDGTYYEKEDGEYATGFMDIEGQRYFFNEEGILVTGKFYVKDQDAYYYADKNGIIQVGVINFENAFYVTDEVGRIKTGFVDYDGQRYFFNSKADLVFGWFKNDKNWYYADDRGIIMTGFLTLDGYRYYLNPDGTRVSDSVVEIDGITYVFNADGSIDENATTLYPVYEYLNKVATDSGKKQIEMNAKVQACAILRAADLVNGFQQSEEGKTLETLLKNRGISCAGGYEFSYGGVNDYGIERLIEDMKKDINIQDILKNETLSEMGLGIFEVDGIYYYDIIFIMKGENKDEK